MQACTVVGLPDVTVVNVLIVICDTMKDMVKEVEWCDVTTQPCSDIIIGWAGWAPTWNLGVQLFQPRGAQCYQMDLRWRFRDLIKCFKNEKKIVLICSLHSY